MQFLASLSFLGIPFIILGVVAVIVGVVLNFKQKAIENESDFDDYDEDPDVIRVSRIRKIALVGGGIIGIFGALLLSAPEWATII